MRRIAFSLALCLVAACGEDDEDRNPPPVGSGAGVPMVGSAGDVSATSGASGSGGGSGGSSGIPTTGLTMGPLTDSDSTGAAPLDIILTGRFLDGGGGYPLPITCTVRFHRPGEINPSNGIETATTFSRAVQIDAFPQSFSITNDDIGGVVMLGDPGYVTSECDIDGDNFFDDAVGAYFPTLPMTEISIPASSIDLTVGPI